MFSSLRNLFGERQNTSLQDYVEASLMLQYNYSVYDFNMFFVPSGLMLFVVPYYTNESAMNNMKLDLNNR